MTELQINLTITALTLVVACSIGALAGNLSEYLDNTGIESQAAEFQPPRVDDVAPAQGAEAGAEAGPATATVAMK